MAAERISVEECEQRLETGWVYLDVRTTPEFEAGHPQGAYNVPIKLAGADGLTANPDFVATVQANFDLGTPVIVGCQSGRRSQSAAQLLEEAGFTVAENRAGFGGSKDAFGQILEPGWLTAGRAVSSEVQPGRSFEELKRSYLRATADGSSTRR
ncbi:MAG: rhodanese-like domain-containing protein [Myxococcota bacterium]